MSNAAHALPTPAHPLFEVLVYRGLEPRQLGARVDAVIEQLRHGDFRSAEVKKLRSGGLYRARLDEKNRLLFQLGAHGGRRLLLVLEVIHNHAYDRSRFLGGGRWAEEDFEPLHAPAAELPATAQLPYVHPSSPVLHVLDRPLSFDDAQAAVQAAPLPLIVIGPAGSGKTALTLERLKELPGHGLYVSRSSYLVDNARALYRAGHYTNDGQEVAFLSLRELLETIDVPRGKEATYRDFATWFERMRGGFRVRRPHELWEEIKGVLTGAASTGPYLSAEEYLALGVRQSIFLGEERGEVLRIFERWRAHLAEAGLFDSSMAAWERLPKAERIYDFVVVDEVQDVTPVELRLCLATLRERSSLLLAGDSNQIVHPNLFSWARVRGLFREAEELPQRIHILSANYRNTRAVTALANRLLMVKQRRFGSVDRESNYLVSCVSGEEGRADLVEDGPELRKELEARTRRSVHHAILVLRDDDKAAARAAFSTPLVFSVHEAKGLEYEHVVLFNLVSGAEKEFRECAAGVSPADLEGELAYARARDKADKSLDAHKFYVNALYVAMTRAVRSLLVVERDPEHPLLQLLAFSAEGAALGEPAGESSREEWEREAHRLELQGKLEQAEQIRREILEHRPVPWEVLDAGSFAKVRERALEKKEKAAQQLLFEWALTYHVPQLLPALVTAGFKHALKPESGREYIERTHHAEYRYRNSPALQKQLGAHGVDFRNPLGQTPLLLAARLGRADLVQALLAQGADPSLTDCAGRTPLRAALQALLDKELKPAAFEDVFALLAGAPMKVKVGSRMAKLDPSGIEWLLVQLLLVDQRRRSGEQQGVTATSAAALEKLIEALPASVVPPHRRKRAYLSSCLSRNEVFGNNPYNRRLLLRAQRGAYVLNPALELDVKDSWRDAYEVIGMPVLFEAMGPSGDRLRDMVANARRTVLERLERGGGGVAKPAA